MAKAYSVAEARAHLPEILNHVQAGKDVQLNRRGHLVAVVVSGERYEALRRRRPTFATAYQAFLDRNPLAAVGLTADSWAGVRDTGPGRKVRL